MTNEFMASRAGTPITPQGPELRRVLGHFCTGIAVITAHDGARPIGFTCQSVTSVSLDPPYVSFCPASTSTSWPMIREVGTICVNILAAEQQDICAQFATRRDDKFSGIEWSPGANGAPTLQGSLASIEAEVEFEHTAGDHSIVVARVSDVWAQEERRPLLFYRGGYGAFAEVTRA